jgi:hypothetical protein
MSTLTLPQNDCRIEHAANHSGSVHVASLETLPPGFQFPGELRDRIWYDRAQQRLLFRGFMSKAMFDRLDGCWPIGTTTGRWNSYSARASTKTQARIASASRL